MLHSNVYKLTAAASNNKNGVQNQVTLTCALRSQDTPWGVGTGVEQIRGFWDAGMVFPLFFGKNYGCWLHGFLVHISIKVVVAVVFHLFVF